MIKKFENSKSYRLNEQKKKARKHLYIYMCFFESAESFGGKLLSLPIKQTLLRQLLRNFTIPIAYR